ncbi:MAG: NUDIX hydrolase [Deltaproteobacteria bacterium]|nr:NUDIX hydrolase [Deltaproteobacteria bacterium]
MKIRKWNVVHSEIVFENSFMKIQKSHHCMEDNSRDGDFFRLGFPDWANVIPMTDDGKIILINQFRHGTLEFSTEIPGGVLENGEKPLDGARRELLEETGFTSDDWTYLGKVSPNNAIQTNFCHVFLAKGCRKTHDVQFDDDEEIEMFTATQDELYALVSSGSIKNSVVLSALLLNMCRK